jgi:hypothetical protein
MNYQEKQASEYGLLTYQESLAERTRETGDCYEPAPVKVYLGASMPKIKGNPLKLESITLEGFGEVPLSNPQKHPKLDSYYFDSPVGEVAIHSNCIQIWK